MKRIFEWIGGFALIAFSFYFTDRVSLLVASKSDLMLEIREVSKEYKEDAIDAKINKNDNTIVPGKYGRKVDENESYLSMHSFGVFNENYLVYTPIKPSKSIEENKDKYITSGNESNREVSLIIDNNPDIIKYLESSNIKFDLIASLKSDIQSTSIEYINGANEPSDFKAINSKVSSSKKICLKDYSNENLCLKYKYYILMPLLKLNSVNISEIKNKISGGSIILISSTSKLEHIKLLLNEIYYKDLDIVYVSDLINEKR